MLRELYKWLYNTNSFTNEIITGISRQEKNPPVSYANVIFFLHYYWDGFSERMPTEAINASSDYSVKGFLNRS